MIVATAPYALPPGPITSVGSLGASSNKASVTSASHTTTAAALAGSIVVVIVSKDNVATTAGVTSEVTGVTDSAGNTYAKAYEYTNPSASPAAGAGATCAVFFSRLANPLPLGGSITAAFSSAIVAKALSAWNFAVGNGGTLALEGATGRAGTNTLPAQTVSGLENVEHLAMRAYAVETGETFGYVSQTGWTLFETALTAGGGLASNSRVSGEFGIVAPSTSLSTSGGNETFRDMSMLLLVFKAAAV